MWVPADVLEHAKIRLDLPKPPKVGWAIFRGFGPLFYLLWGFR